MRKRVSGIGGRICKARYDKCMTSAQLAAAVGVNIHTVYHWELGSTQVKHIELRKLALVLGVSADYLVGLDDARVYVPRCGNAKEVSRDGHNRRAD